MYVLLLLFFKLYYIYSNSIITFSFKRILNNEIITNETFYENYFNNIIYTKLKIGTPNTEISVQIKSKQYSFCIRNDSIYNYSNSSSYEFYDNKELDIYNSDFRFSIKSNETFKLGNENILIEDLKYMLTKESNYNLDGIIGLQILDNNGKVWGYNLISQLKSKNLIDKECFFYIFENNSYNGKLLIGQYPHLIDEYKNKYHEEQFIRTPVFIPSYDQNFDFNFRSVFWDGKEIDILSVAHVEIEKGIIIGSMKFCDASWDFFAPHFINKKCKRVDVQVLYQSYICDDYEDLDITKFPNIEFYINDHDYHFILTYEDIFLKKDGKVYFMICFNKKGYPTTWTLGNIFLKRNMIIFDMDRKIMGIYNTSISPDNDKDKYNNIFNNYNTKFFCLIIIIIIATIVIIGLAVFIIINFVYKKRKKKVYELDEDYDYSNPIKSTIND